MIETLITNKTRIKLLFRLFLNPGSTGYLRGLEEEFNESSNAIRVELNRFEAAGMLESYQEKNKKIYRANKKHPLYAGINEILLKHLGIDQILEKIVSEPGNIQKVYITGPLAQGQYQGPLELLIVGDDLDTENLNRLIDKAEKRIGRNIVYTIYNQLKQKTEKTRKNEWMLIWNRHQ